MHKYEDGCEHVRDYAVLKHEKFTTEQHTEKDTKLDDSCHTEHGSRRLRAAHTEEEAQRLQRPVTEHANRISTAAQRHTCEMGTTTQRLQRPATGHANRKGTAAQRRTGKIGAAAQRHASEMGTTTQRYAGNNTAPGNSGVRVAAARNGACERNIEHRRVRIAAYRLESSQFEPEDKTTAKENVEAKWITYRTILGWGQTAAQRHKIIWHGGTK
ncbi:hypothetical protein R3P38DRAFT_2787374 [Favolaschia claudopus]|uniref:Uncharacterized protein n=1 Tax=Favolaschia claudopus TaxID=2862362 RepID=A0AAW0AN02_9AGAR